MTVVVKNPADFVGSVLGGSEANTKGILASSVGKVLIIDEAYMLASGAASGPYKIAVIDTIVAEVQSTQARTDASYYSATRMKWKRCSETSTQD
jgi:hypothetical protein